MTTDAMDDDAIAIVGMACRVPGAEHVGEFWRNLCDGVDSVRRFAPEELRAAGVADELLGDPRYVAAGATLTGADLFDAAFFGYSPAEAAAMDPQQRVFLEAAWSALEHAGYDPHDHDGTTGVFAGSAANKYFLFHVLPDARHSLNGRAWDGEDLPVGVSLDSLPARVSYKLRLTGPSVAVQTACSTSLVAVCMACQSLMDHRCDTALAGGVALELPSRAGYLYQEGGMLAVDGRCRSFDAGATGSVFGSGVGVVVLKRLADAVSAGDRVYSVIRGWAVNNDGGDRVGYAAPGVNGQAAVVAEAQAVARVDARSIGYVEAHGSATPLGDPIEVAALTKAFRRSTNDVGFCALGTVKTNVGHLDAAAGVIGLIKTTLAVEHGLVPPSLHFEEPNPEIDFARSPFFVNTVLAPWPLDGPRRAGVSSFGVGGTNAHVIVEQAPESELPGTARRPAQLFTLSARSDEALTRAAADLSELLERSESDDAEVAYTLATGRSPFRHRSALVRRAGRRASSPAVRGVVRDLTPTDVTFMLPGTGEQYVGAGAEIYRQEPVFAQALDHCAERLAPTLGVDLRTLLYPAQNQSGAVEAVGDGAGDLRKMVGRAPESESERALHQPLAGHPITFSLTYALAELLRSWGVEPTAMIGHSMGEYVAACIASVVSVDDALELVGRRARIIAGVREGSMLAVPLDEGAVVPLLRDGISLAAVNAPGMCVLAGEVEVVDEVESILREAGVVAQRLRTTHALHSDAMREARGALEELLADIELRSPQIPYVSNLTGTWITDEQATDPAYWGTHLCQTVRFADGLGRVLERAPSILLEVGPGRTLSSLATARGSQRPELEPIHMLDPHYDHRPSDVSLLEAVGRLWVAGAAIDWAAFYKGREQQRAAAPTVPFERRRHWIERVSVAAVPVAATQQAPGLMEPRPASATLAEQSLGARPLDTQYIAPRTDMERLLADAWSELLGIHPIGLDDDFTELGGHSLMALQLANRLWDRHRVELSLTTLFEHETLGAVSAALVGDQGDLDAPPRSFLPRSAMTELDPDDEPVAPLEAWLGTQIGTWLGRTPQRDERLGDRELTVVVPELLRVVRRDHGIPLYPNEVADHPSVRSLASYLANEMRRIEQLGAASADGPRAERTARTIPARAAFVLSSVRSGSTLLRVMLAGHPDLFCPPELHLLSCRTMGERAQAEPSPDRDQGLCRTLMELRDVDMAQAEAEVAQMTRADLGTAEVLSRLADAANPRLLVEKSPGNANAVATLRGIERDFDAPLYIVLLRHPYAVVESVVRNRFVRLMGGGELDPYDFGELVWTRSYGNILDFVETLPSERFAFVRYEELVARPRETLEPLCSLLDVEYSDELLRPYEGRRMRDGLGDPNFLQHDGIDASLGEAWRHVRLARPLGRAARLLADGLGYELPPFDSASKATA